MPPHDARRPLRACRFRSGFPRPRAWLRLGLGAALWLGLAAGAAAQAQAPAEADARLLERGRSLAIAADCLACHTQAGGGKPYAGGYPINSPLGVIYASNITPSKTAGIGDYSEADFARALREGVRKDGARLYPAMPYTSYTLITDEDMKALYAYFMKGVAPVDEPAPVTRLPFPFSVRASMLGWNLLFLDNRRYTPDPSRASRSTVAPIWPMRWRIAAAAIRRATRSWPRTPAARWAVGPSGRGTRRTSARIPSLASAAGRRTNWCSTCAPAASPARSRPAA